jgi:phage terminase large subunit-like protein
VAANRTAHKPLRPFTVDHFRAYARNMVLDNGALWNPEAFQLEVVGDVFAWVPEVWEVVPEGNGKTTLMGGLGLYHGDYMPAAAVPMAAASRDQCLVLFGQAAGFVRRTPGLDKRFRVFEGYRKIRCLRTGGEIQVFAADDKTGDGIIPSLALVDEPHRQKDLRLYRTWRGKLEKRGGQIVAISTAGEPGSDFEDTRDRILREATKTTVSGKYGSHIRAEGEGIVLHDWAVRDRTKADDMKVVAEANPRRAITAEVLGKKRRSSTMTKEHWLRFVCNIATRTSGQAILPEEWGGLFEEGLEPDPAAWCIGWLDLGWKIDTTAMGLLYWESRERRPIVDIDVIAPPVDEGDIVRGLVERQRRHSPVGWVYDPSAGGAQMAQLLEKGEHPHQGGVQFNFIEHSQDNAPMALAAQRFDEAIRAGWLRHDGDPDLRAHALNAVKKSLGANEKWRYDRPPDAKGERRAKFPIDALTGAVMGHSVAVGIHEDAGPPINPDDYRIEGL